MMHRACLLPLLLASACLRGTYNDTDTSTGSESSTGGPSTTTDDPTAAGTSTGETTGPAPACGDGNLDEGEECDDGNDNGDDKACTSSCQTNVCGDGKPGPEEECDDGADNGDDKACTAGCKENVCGDGLVEDGEEACDNGAENNEDTYDGCTTLCELGPRCGDSVVNGPEECDDGNPDDEDLCSNACVAAEMRFVFVTSGIYNGKLGGIGGADAQCKVAANAADVGSPTAGWVAWLSDGAKSAASRMDTTFTGFYVLPTTPPTPVAKGWAGLTSGTLLHPIDRTETGAQVEEPFEVWTNTSISGDILDPGTHCTNWTSANGQQQGNIGLSNAADGTWTESPGGFTCAASLHLYCIENP